LSSVPLNFATVSKAVFMTFTAKQLFLADGLGAILTATLLSQVLARWPSLFGVPASVLYVLAGIAACFALYSLSCYFMLRERHGFYLRIIATANTLYCLATLGLMVSLPGISWLGIAYFIGEIIVILLLVNVEFRTAAVGRGQRA
jgi:hypothetical protein